MDTLDLVVILVALSAMVGGWRLGFLARATSWVGLAAGLALSARMLPTVLDAMRAGDATTRLFVAAGVLVGGAFLGQALGLVIGAQFHRALPIGPLRIVDRTFGAAAGVAGVAVALWAMLPAMAGVPGWPARQAAHSVIARAIDRIAPPPPDTLQALRRLVGETQFPRVFADLGPSRSVGPPPVASGLAPEVEQRVKASTVKVSGVACRRIQEGSGFVAGRDTIVTNAHVVAGSERTEVLRPDGSRLRATVAVFDPDRDLALLRVPGVTDPLPLAEGQTGETGAVFGHPGGQEEVRVSPAAISERVVAVGRDLYDARETRRDVFILAADLHPGDSGGALVDAQGAVIGVAFAIAPDRRQTAYALTTAELRPVLAAGVAGQADTGPCLR